MAYVPGLDMLNYLDAHSTAVTGNTNLFQGIVRAPTTGSPGIPVECVFVVGDAGPPPFRVLGTATEIRQPTVSILVRSSGFTAGQTLAWAVHDALQSASPSTGNAYMDVQTQQSQPNFLEQDKNGHYFWSINVLTRYQT